MYTRGLSKAIDSPDDALLTKVDCSLVREAFCTPAHADNPLMQRVALCFLQTDYRLHIPGEADPWIGVTPKQVRAAACRHSATSSTEPAFHNTTARRQVDEAILQQLQAGPATCQHN